MLKFNRDKMDKYQKAVIEKIEDTLRERGWRPADLARASGLTEPGISKILNGDRRAGDRSLVKIADALNIPREEMLRIAGVLPPGRTDRQAAKDLLDYFNDREFDMIWDYLRWRYSEQRKRNQESNHSTE
jgi:transcriptional regulator with XRE-family HTH domain